MSGNGDLSIGEGRASNNRESIDAVGTPTNSTKEPAFAFSSALFITAVAISRKEVNAHKMLYSRTKLQIVLAKSRFDDMSSFERRNHPL